MTEHTDEEQRCPSCNYEYTLRLQSEMGIARCPRCNYSYRVELEDNGFKALATKEETEAYREEAIKEKESPAVSLSESRPFSRKRTCPICKGEGRVSISPRTLSWAGCRKCEYDVEVQLPLYWLALMTLLALLIPLLMVFGFFGFIIFLVLFTFLHVDAHLLLSQPMNNSLDKSILKSVEKEKERGTDATPRADTQGNGLSKKDWLKIIMILAAVLLALAVHRWFMFYMVWRY